MRSWHFNVPIPSVAGRPIRTRRNGLGHFGVERRVGTALFPLHTGERRDDRHACGTRLSVHRARRARNSRRTAPSVDVRTFLPAIPPLRTHFPSVCARCCGIATINHLGIPGPTHGFRSVQPGSLTRKLRLLASMTVSCEPVAIVNTLVSPRTCQRVLHVPTASPRARRLPVETGFRQAGRRK